MDTTPHTYIVIAIGRDIARVALWFFLFLLFNQVKSQHINHVLIIKSNFLSNGDHKIINFSSMDQNMPNFRSMDITVVVELNSWERNCCCPNATVNITLTGLEIHAVIEETLHLINSIYRLNVGPLCLEKKNINALLLITALIKLWFNPVYIAFTGEELKPNIGEQGGALIWML